MAEANRSAARKATWHFAGAISSAGGQAPTFDLPEFAFAGRSNVGKSTLINRLVRSPGLARTSSTPGRTQQINFFLLPERMVFADLPGYGYAKISKSISSTWPEFIEPYLAARPTLALAICLVDSNIPPQPSDRQLIEWLDSVGRSSIVVATKADRLSGNERTRNLAALKKGLGCEEILPISAKTGYGLKELWARIETAAAATEEQ